MNLTVVMTLRNEVKHSVRYDGPAELPSMYVPKIALPTPFPTTLTVVITAE